jgi:hypothetical protein
MLKQQAGNQDTVDNTESSNDEEHYQKLFKKIARDFVYKGDLVSVLSNFYEKILQIQTSGEDLNSKEVEATATAAVMQAIEYRENLSLPKHQRKTYEDVIDNDQ